MSRATHQPYRACRGACRRHSGGVASPSWRAESQVRRGEQKADRHECQEGERGQGISTRPRALTDKTLTNLEQVYERSATGEAITETEEAICNHSHSDL